MSYSTYTGLLFILVCGVFVMAAIDLAMTIRFIKFYKEKLVFHDQQITEMLGKQRLYDQIIAEAVVK